MRLVILESPYGGDIEENVRYARACVRDSLSRGEAPIASHLLYTQPGILRDELPDERTWGIAAGLAWGEVAEATVVYVDRGVSSGMQHGIDNALRAGRVVERRMLTREAWVAMPQRETYCALCDREHQLHEDAQGFHHVIKGERVECPVSSTNGDTHDRLGAGVQMNRGTTS